MSTDLNLILFYRPPNSTSPLNTIYDILNDVHEKNNLIILGDFNLNPDSLRFKNILNDLNLKQHIIDSTHRLSHNQKFSEQITHERRTNNYRP